MKKPTQHGTSVRFDSDTLERLRKVSYKSGVKIAKLIREATNRYLTDVEKAGKIEISIEGDES